MNPFGLRLRHVDWTGTLFVTLANLELKKRQKTGTYDGVCEAT
jgi:hypothetical protein